MEFHQIRHAHPTHTRGYNIALFELVTPWRLLDNASGLDAEDAWIHDARRVTKAGKELRAIDAKSLDTDQDLAWLWDWDGPQRLEREFDG
jgi:hypothetical protein